MDPVEKRVDEALAWLRKRSKKSVRDGMARYAIPADKALGVGMKDIQALARGLGRDHALAQALWDRTPHAWAMVTKWSTRRAEFEKRAAFALLASLALHDKTATSATS